MEELVMENLFGAVYKNRKVLVTGHTGFKGSWLTMWLSQMGADVAGYALEPETSPNHFDLLSLDYRSIFSDIRDIERLRTLLMGHQPEIVFHLAAQPLVRRGYREPIETFSTNVMGTVNLLEVCRECSSVRAVVIITTDKCYENTNGDHAYREEDRLGGWDPYSASKACAEIVTASYRRSYFSPEQDAAGHHLLVASARAGNVIGGGDWSEDRLIPDIVRAAQTNQTVVIRNPRSTRPWQHVLEPLSGYLMLGQNLLEGKSQFADAWNFGPAPQENYSVESIVDLVRASWPRIKADTGYCATNMHEAQVLRLECSKAFGVLQWKPVWPIGDTVEKTVLWYRQFYEKRQVSSREQLLDYTQTARKIGLPWACS